MAPTGKQATLGYVRPAQQTLDAYFKRSAGAAAKPTLTHQTKLSFATKSAGPKREEKTAEEVDNKKRGRKVANKEDESGGKDDWVDAEEKDDDANDDDDDEPVVKRARKRQRRAQEDEAADGEEEKGGAGKEKSEEVMEEPRSTRSTPKGAKQVKMETLSPSPSSGTKRATSPQAAKQTKETSSEAEKQVKKETPTPPRKKRAVSPEAEKLKEMLSRLKEPTSPTAEKAKATLSSAKRATSPDGRESSPGAEKKKKRAKETTASALKKKASPASDAEDDGEGADEQDDVSDSGSGYDSSASASQRSGGEKVAPAAKNKQPAVKSDPKKVQTKPKKTTKAAQAKLDAAAAAAAQARDAYPDWSPGEPVPYAALCATFSLVELTTKRLAIAEYCTNFLHQILRLTPIDLLPTILLMTNKVAPAYAGIELGIGEALIMKAIGETTGRSLQVIRNHQKEVGDLGLVAAKSRSTQRTMVIPKRLTVRSVYRALLDIAATVTGDGAQTRKVDGIKRLFASADAGTKAADITMDNKGGPSEIKFIVRFLEGKPRLGLADKTVVVAVAQAVARREIEQLREKGADVATADLPDPEEAATILKSVYNAVPSWDKIVPPMLQHGIMNLKDTCPMRPGVPLKPMLAKPTKAITEVLNKFENRTFTCEYKYDGERAQIHYVAADAAPVDPDQMERPVSKSGAVTAPVGGGTKGVAAIFSRNLEDLSKKYPDVLARLHGWVRDGTKSFVLDCETVAWDVDEKKVLPFQQLQTRKRKDVKIEDVKVKVCLYGFDLIYLNGESLVEKSLRERRELLRAAFLPVEGEFTFAAHMDSRELNDIQLFMEESVKASCEGLMVKMLDGDGSGYEPSKRSSNWLKIKKDYLAGVGDSLDLVVLGAYFGKGKRTSLYGAFLLACCNPGRDTYETICKIGTGFSDLLLAELHADLSGLVIDHPKPFYSHPQGNQHQPDVWFEPRRVWEVRTADLTLSPCYKAAWREGVDGGVGGGGGDGGERGISLRFPRFVRVREDKKPDEATSSRQVAEMYRRQGSMSVAGGGKGVDDDYEY